MNNIFNSFALLELLHTGSEYLEAHGIAEPRTEADILMAYVLETSRDRLYLERDLQISRQDREKYAGFLIRRGNRKPLAYLLKTREFMGLEFYVDSRVLIPRPETEILVEIILEIGKNISYRRKKILDLCTGSGALAVAIAYYWREAAIVAADISQEALNVAVHNADLMKVKIDFRQGDLFQPVINERFDIIVSNPPYVSASEYSQCSPEVRQEPSLALLGGIDGLEFYRRIAAQADHFLYPGGVILMEIGSSQGIKVAEIFAGQAYKTVIIPDYAGLDRIVRAEKE